MPYPADGPVTALRGTDLFGAHNVTPRIGWRWLKAMGLPGSGVKGQSPTHTPASLAAFAACADIGGYAAPLAVGPAALPRTIYNTLAAYAAHAGDAAFWAGHLVVTGNPGNHTGATVVCTQDGGAYRAYSAPIADLYAAAVAAMCTPAAYHAALALSAASSAPQVAAVWGARHAKEPRALGAHRAALEAVLPGASYLAARGDALRVGWLAGHLTLPAPATARVGTLHLVGAGGAVADGLPGAGAGTAPCGALGHLKSLG